MEDNQKAHDESTKPGGTFQLNLSHAIDLHKALTPLVIAILMSAYGAWDNVTVHLYWACHSAYCLLWLMKGHTFPDKEFKNACSLQTSVFLFLFLALYWVAPWFLVSRHVRAPPWYSGLCVFLYSVGMFYHYVSDMQKFMHLKHCPGKLLTSGLWATSRNPNYFGELLLYTGFDLLAMHWVPLAFLAFAVVSVWLPNMQRKDKSLSRYPEFQAWKKRTSMLIPKFW